MSEKVRKLVPRFSAGGNRFGIFVYEWDNWWFRIIGYGLSMQPLDGHKMFFSERYGQRLTLHKLGHCWELLKP